MASFQLSSWISVKSDSHFPIQNIPFGIISYRNLPARAATVVGDYAVDLSKLYDADLLDNIGIDKNVFAADTLNSFMTLPKSTWTATRLRIISLLSSSPDADKRLRSNDQLKSEALIPINEITMHLPASIGDYTDFFSSKDHAYNCGVMFRGPENALQPNWLHLPVGYHGRASSIVTTGTPVRRPSGQIHADRSDPKKGSIFSPCKQLDFELELGFFLGGPENSLGSPIDIRSAEERVFGCVLLNDWSARDIQAWEYVPLGPFTAKSFCSSISPWVVTMDALEEFRCSASQGPVQNDPTPLAYLQDPDYHRGFYDIQLQVGITPSGVSSEKETVVSTSNSKYLYWNVKQHVAHHSVTGCNLRPGDLFGTGTISGPKPESYGSLLELSWKGTKPLSLQSNDATNPIQRCFLDDGDTVTMTGFAQKEKDGQILYRIGFGEVSGTILPAI